MVNCSDPKQNCPICGRPMTYLGPGALEGHACEVFRCRSAEDGPAPRGGRACEDTTAWVRHCPCHSSGVATVLGNEGGLVQTRGQE